MTESQQPGESRDIDMLCSRCNAPLHARYVERGGLVYMQVGGVLMLRGICANCGGAIHFPPSDEPLAELLARQAARWDRINAQIEAARAEVRGGEVSK